MKKLYSNRFKTAILLLSLSLLSACFNMKEGENNILSSASETPPNIVWIIADDQAFNDFGFMGHDIIKTPNLDILASQSAVFPNGYVPSSLCRASLATLITGKYAFDHGICFNDPPEGFSHADTFKFLKIQRPIPMELKKKGYRSMQTGKFWEGVYSNGGFTDGMTQGRRHGDEGLKIGRQTMQPIDDFLANNAKDPFFLWFAPYLPHAPFDADARFSKDYLDKGLNEREIGYYANIAWLDETIGQLMDLLEKRDQMDNTIIMFIVDNGWAPAKIGQSYRDLQGRRLPFDPRSKSSPYEDGVRTPIMVKWPGRIKPARYNELVSSVDFFPTTLAMAGLPQNPVLKGTNLLPFLQQKSNLNPRTIFGEIYYHTSVNLDDPKINITHRWARKGDWKLIVNDYDKGRPELYNLITDPKEKDNKANDADQKKRLDSMVKEIDNWWKSPPTNF